MNQFFNRRKNNGIIQMLGLFIIALFTSTFANAQYCEPTFLKDCSDGNNLQDFVVYGDFGTTLIDTTTGCSGDYDDRTAKDTVSFLPSGMYLADVVSDSSGNHAVIWIDFNDDDIFQVNEMVGYTTTEVNAYGSSIVINIPLTATPGYHRMRVMLGYDDNGSPSSFDPCNTSYVLESGEVHDYIVEIVGLADCIGTPTAGATFPKKEVCMNEAFSVVTQGASNPANGLDRYWESSTDSLTWNTLLDSYFTEYTQEGGVSDTMYYRYVVVCNNSNESDTSNVITVTFKKGEYCYCQPIYVDNCVYRDRIGTVELAGETKTLNNKTQCSYAGYGNYTNTNIPKPDLYQGGSYMLHVTSEASIQDSVGFKAWIDYNRNGVFESTEEISNTGILGMGSTGKRSAQIDIPQDVPNGDYRMRIRLVYIADASLIHPCAEYEKGEVEDYMIHIGEPCVNPIVDLGLDTTICPSASIVLDAGNPGLEYEWIDGSSEQTFTATIAGTYTVKVKSEECVTTDTITISKSPYPSADPFEVTQLDVCSYEFEITNIEETDSLSWNFGDGSPAVSGTNVSHVYTENGTYQVVVTLYNDCDSTKISKVVKCTTLGVDELTNASLSVYPNPTSDKLNIVLASEVMVREMKLINALGQIVYTNARLNENTIVLNVADYPSGIYVVSVQTDEGIYTKKVDIIK